MPNTNTKNVSVGTVEGTGSAISITCGFKPLAVEVKNVDGVAILKWDASMADANGMKLADSGAGATDISLITSNGITPTFNGFTIGADTDVNVSAQTINWVAWK